jgi:hypothetical protein
MKISVYAMKMPSAVHHVIAALFTSSPEWSNLNSSLDGLLKMHLSGSTRKDLIRYMQQWIIDQVLN